MKAFIKKKIDFLRRHPRSDIAMVVIALAIFATIALLNAARASLWFDEAFSAYITQFNFAEIAAFTSADVHPPFYYWLLKVWEMLFGTSDLAIRSMSVFFGGVVIVLSYLLTRRLFGRLSAGVSLVFLALSPMLIRYSDEARMYTVAAAIILLATYVLVKATESNKRRYWVIYGLLVGLGMWTHYFTAVAWLTHWVWRAIVTRRGTTKWKNFWPKFFTKNWIVAYVVAIAVFIPWLPFMALQLGTIQGVGFWISSVTADSFTNYFSNLFYYLEHDQVFGWWAFLLWAVIIGLVIVARKTFKVLGRQDKINYLLTTVLASAPVVILFVMSLPPLRSSFVERYLLIAVIGFAMFAAVTLVVGTRNWRPWARVIPVVLIAGMMIFGITNVYYYGNYNKNTNMHVLTGEVVQAIAKKAAPGEPIVADSPWTFYEAIAYTSADHPVYFIDKNTDYIYGSLDMLEKRDQHKIKDLESFKRAHPIIWYIGTTTAEDVPPFESDWKKLTTVSVYDSIDNKTEFRATQYQVSAE